MLIPNELLNECSVDERWMSGPFFNLKALSAKTKGKRFEQIAHYIFEQKGFTVEKPSNTDHDRIVSGQKIEIKGSTITKNSDDCFSFLQIRPDQDYDFLVLQTFWFDGTIKFYKISKKTVINMIKNGVFKKQHGGNKAESRTFCYNGNTIPFEKNFWFEVKIKV